MDRNQHGPRHRRFPRGVRLRMGFPHGHRKTIILVAGLRLSGIVAPMVLGGPINGDWFEAYVRHVLTPTPHPSDIYVIDNLSSHKRVAAEKLIEAAGAELRFVPPYNPDLDPIKMAFPKLQALRPKAAERTVESLWNAIGRLEISSRQPRPPTSSQPQDTSQNGRQML